MLAAEGILTARGGLVSHAAVVARGWGKPAVVGAEVLRLGDRTVTRRRRDRCHEGDWISLDGGAGIVVLGQVPLTAAKPPAAFDDRPRRGPTRSARATWPCGPTPTPATTRPTPASSAPRASACAAPSTCSWARTACPSCAA